MKMYGQDGITISNCLAQRRNEQEIDKHTQTQRHAFFILFILNILFLFVWWSVHACMHIYAHDPYLNVGLKEGDSIYIYIYKSPHHAYLNMEDWGHLMRTRTTTLHSFLVLLSPMALHYYTRVGDEGSQLRNESHPFSNSSYCFVLSIIWMLVHISCFGCWVWIWITCLTNKKKIII